MFKKRRNIKNATVFKVHYSDVGVSTSYSVREFSSAKSMEQWIVRQDTAIFGFVVRNRYALIEEEWEVFTTIGKKHYFYPT